MNFPSDKVIERERFKKTKHMHLLSQLFFFGFKNALPMVGKRTKFEKIFKVEK